MLRDDKGVLWFAGDRRISWNFSKAIKGPRPKVTNRNGILLAGTGTSFVCDLVTDQFPVPEYIKGTDTFGYIHKMFIPELIKWLRSEGWAGEHDRKLNIECEGDADDAPMAIIVIGVGSDLYELDIDNKMICADAIDAPYATGCGGALALGSLLTTEGLGDIKLSCKQRLGIALRVAAQISPGCDANIDIINNK
jgi:hypothetical protein